jgi:hypothetical protein
MTNYDVYSRGSGEKFATIVADSEADAVEEGDMLLYGIGLPRGDAVVRVSEDEYPYVPVWHARALYC